MNDAGERLSFPDHEARLPWLATLLQMYHLTDGGVHEGIRREEKQGRELACGRGCSTCCRTHTTIPVYPIELMGLYWYVSEQMEPSRREQLRERLEAHEKGQPCPFLIDEVCSVHPLRPMACRNFNVFGQRCAEGEDAYYSRRGDVLTPLKKPMDEAFDLMLAFHGLKEKGERRRALKAGRQHAYAQVLQECNWASLLQQMQKI